MIGQWVFQFSSELFDVETGMVCYNYRYYNAMDGRWINRDPANELGGANLFAYAKNNTVNHFDNLGLISNGYILRLLLAGFTHEKNLKMVDDGSFAANEEVATYMSVLATEVMKGLCAGTTPSTGSKAMDVNIGRGQGFVVNYMIGNMMLHVDWSCTKNAKNRCCQDCEMSWKLTDYLNFNNTNLDFFLASLTEMGGHYYDDGSGDEGLKGIWRHRYPWYTLSLGPAGTSPFILKTIFTFQAFAWEVSFPQKDTGSYCYPDCPGAKP